jgi:hypothetical protein
MNKKQNEEATNTTNADERTQRRIAEEQAGGISSQESAERYASGDNPGGTHQGGTQADPEGGKPNNYEDLGMKKGRGPAR